LQSSFMWLGDEEGDFSVFDAATHAYACLKVLALAKMDASINAY